MTPTKPIWLCSFRAPNLFKAMRKPDISISKGRGEVLEMSLGPWRLTAAALAAASRKPWKSRANVPVPIYNGILHYQFVLAFAGDDDDASVISSRHAAGFLEMHRVGAEGQCLPHGRVLRIWAPCRRCDHSNWMISILRNSSDYSMDEVHEVGLVPTHETSRCPQGNSPRRWFLLR